MLRELRNIRQVPGDPLRRWFTSKTMDLIVWLSEADLPMGFQFCYNKGRTEKSLTWWGHSGYVHRGVDDGEDNGRLQYKSSPVLVHQVDFDTKLVIKLLLDHSENVPSEFVAFVHARIVDYGASLAPPTDRLRAFGSSHFSDGRRERRNPLRMDAHMHLVSLFRRRAEDRAG